MPLAPTPPKGRSGTPRWTIVWLTATPPERVRSIDPLGGRRVVGEHVQRQRMRPGVDEGDRLVDVVDGDHRQDRAEDLLGHHGRVGRATPASTVGAK